MHSEKIRMMKFSKIIAFFFELLLVFIYESRASPEHSLGIIGHSIQNAYENFKNFFQEGSILPGTNYCGKGSRAKFPGDFGSHLALDECCMKHDKCTDLICTGEEKHDLRNETKFTLLNCSCDHEFFHCLKGIIKRDENKKSAVTIGFIYFDRPQFPKCFKYDYPIIACIQRSKWFGRCKEYKLDTNQEKRWQFFDLPVFELLGHDNDSSSSSSESKEDTQE